MGLRRMGGPGMHGVAGMPLSGMAGGAHGTYKDKILGYGPIAYWMLAEISGTTAVCQINTAQNGTYGRDVSVMGTAAGIGDGNTSPDFDGTNDYVDIYTATLNGVFDGLEGTLHAWIRMDAGTWTDGINHFWMYIRSDANNYIRFQKAAANTSRIRYRANATSNDIDMLGQTTLDYFSLTVTWSDSANEVRGYLNGIQQGAPAAPGTWNGVALDANATLIAIFDAVPPTAPHDGSMAHVVLWDRPLPPTEVANIATVGGG